MELTISRGSWTYKVATVYEKVTGKLSWEYPDQLAICSLFWRLVGAVPLLLFLAMFLILYFVGKGFGWVERTFPWLRQASYWIYRYLGIIIITSVLTLACFLLVFVVMLDFMILLRAVGGAALVLAVVGGLILAISKVEGKGSEIKRSVVVQYAGTFKRRLCPIVRVVDGQSVDGEEGS